jgi:putative CocE/NonD family hydrolase
VREADYGEVRIERDVIAYMRDGCRLSADVYRPAGNGRWPVLLLRQPYGKTLASTVTLPHPLWLARHELMVVVQDVRGRGQSDGEFVPFAHDVEDGYDSVEWAAALPGSTGRVGMYGFSYQGATPLLAARAAPPHLAAISPAMTSGDFYDGWTYQGGAFSLAFAAVWSLQLAIETATRRGDERAANQLALAYGQPRTMYAQLPLDSSGPLADCLPSAAYFDWLAHPTHDAYWRSMGLVDRYGDVAIPGLHIAGWFDSFLPATIRSFVELRRAGRAPQRLIVGPWQHLPWSSTTGGVDWGPEAAPDVVGDEIVAWFRRFLRLRLRLRLSSDPEPSASACVRAFITGRNVWQDFPDWPVQSMVKNLFLSSNGGANSADGNGRLSATPPASSRPDHYVHDPASPVPTVGPGPDTYGYEYGPYDRRAIHVRQDVLVYTSVPLETPLFVVGEPRLALWAATSGVDADFVVYLSELFGDGRARTVSSGVLRARYRESLTDPRWMPRDEAVKLDIRLRPVAHQFEAGSRLRLDLASSCFPLIDRNPGGAESSGKARRGDLRATLQTVFHSADQPSALQLPVVLY